MVMTKFPERMLRSNSEPLVKLTLLTELDPITEIQYFSVIIYLAVSCKDINSQVLLDLCLLRKEIATVSQKYA